MTQNLADLALTEQDFAEPHTAATELADDPPSRGSGRPRKHPFGRTFNPAPPPPHVSASPAALPLVTVESPHDRFLCRPYGTMLTARGCLARQEQRRQTTGGQVPPHLRLCSGCKLGQAVADRLSGVPLAAGAPSRPAETPSPPADVAPGEAFGTSDDARVVQETPTRPEAPVAVAFLRLEPDAATGELRGRIEAARTDPDPSAPTPTRLDPGGLAALEERLTRRHVQSTMAILDSLDELRRIVSDLVTASQEANERIVRQVGAHVAVGRPSVVAEQVLALLSDVPTMFADLTERTEMRRDVLKAALGRLARQERAMWTTLGWVRVDGAEREAAPSADAGPIPGRSETRRERDARARAQRAEGLGGAER